MDEAKRKQFIARLSRALGRDQEMCPAFVEDFDYSHGPQETMFKDLNKDQILTMFKEQCQRVGTKFVETTPDKLGETILAAIEDWGNGKVVFPSTPEVDEYKLKELLEQGAQFVHPAMTFMGFEGKPAGYFVIFCVCAVAYLLGWVIMKALVPKYKPIVLE